MKNKKTLWIAIPILALALFVGCRAIRLDRVPPVGELVQETMAKINPQDDPRTASGTIHADQIRIAAELGGRIVQVHATKGQQVQAGKVLVELDAAQIVDRLAEAEAAVAAAQADLDVVRAGPRDAEIAAARAALALAQAQHSGALSAWQNAAQQAETPQQIDAQIVYAQTQVKLAEQGTILAQAELEREKLLRDQKRKNSKEREIADLQVLAAEKKIARAQADLETAQTTLNWLYLIRSKPLALIARANSTHSQARVAEQGIAVARAGLNDLLAGPTPQEIAVAEQAVLVARAQANVLRANLSKFTLTSPVDGVILNQSLHGGELAAPAATILTLADLSRVTLTVYVPVNQVGHVQLGQQVRVTVDSFPDRTFPGQVTRIGDQPEYTPRNVATQEERLNTFYAVEVHLDNHDHALKPGMPADATFVSTDAPGAQTD